MSRTTKIALLDYGMGNLHSASKALSAVGAEVSITNDPKVVAAADKIFFPDSIMSSLQRFLVQNGAPEHSEAPENGIKS